MLYLVMFFLGGGEVAWLTDNFGPIFATCSVLHSSMSFWGSCFQFFFPPCFPADESKRGEKIASAEKRSAHAHFSSFCFPLLPSLPRLGHSFLDPPAAKTRTDMAATALYSSPVSVRARRSSGGAAGGGGGGYNSSYQRRGVRDSYTPSYSTGSAASSPQVVRRSRVYSGGGGGGRGSGVRNSVLITSNGLGSETAKYNRETALKEIHSNFLRQFEEDQKKYWPARQQEDSEAAAAAAGLGRARQGLILGLDEMQARKDCIRSV